MGIQVGSEKSYSSIIGLTVAAFVFLLSVTMAGLL
jgi:hypothetical protein